MKRTLLFALMAVVCVAVMGSAMGVEKGMVLSAADLKWTDNPALRGARQAVLWGDPAKEAYGAMKSIPGGTKMGLHTHASAQRAVMISGTVDFTMKGEATKALGAGSYVFIPAGAEHDVTCKAGADCVYFEEAMGAADYRPVK